MTKLRYRLSPNTNKYQRGPRASVLAFLCLEHVIDPSFSFKAAIFTHALNPSFVDASKAAAKK